MLILIIGLGQEDRISNGVVGALTGGDPAAAAANRSPDKQIPQTPNSPDISKVTEQS